MARYQLAHAAVATVGSQQRRLKAGTFVCDGSGCNAGDVVLSPTVISGFAPGTATLVGQTGDHPTGVDSVDA